MDVKFVSEEKDTTLEFINSVEELLGKSFPSEYIEFLLKHNGAACYPNFPSIKADTTWRLWQIQRFLSINDIKTYLTQKTDFDLRDHIEEHDLEPYNVQLFDLVIFAIAEQGIFLMNLSDDDHGRIYFSCFSDWDGLVKFETNSFNEFISTLKVESDQPEDYNAQAAKYYIGLENHKSYHPLHFYKDYRREILFDRFKECYDYIHDKAIVYETKSRTFVETWIDHYEVVKYLVEKGHKRKGLVYTKDYKTIKLLLDDNLDTLYEKRKDGEHVYDAPIISWSKSESFYKVFHEFLENDDKINWTFTGLDNLTIIENLEHMLYQYDSKEAKAKRQWKQNSNPEPFEPFFRSTKLEDLIRGDSDGFF